MSKVTGSMKSRRTPRIAITDLGLESAPLYENEVIYLFSQLARKTFRLKIDRIRPAFPDCLAKRGNTTIKIEFELKASSYHLHKHKPRGADWVVCWKNDWERRPQKYRHLKVIALEDYVRAEPRVHVVMCGVGNRNQVKPETITWNVPSTAQVGDVVLMYRSGTGAKCIESLWEIIGPSKYYEKDNPEDFKTGLQAKMKRLSTLTHKVSFSELSMNRQTKGLPIVKAKFAGKRDISERHEPLLKLVIDRNPKQTEYLSAFVK